MVRCDCCNDVSTCQRLVAVDTICDIYSLDPFITQMLEVQGVKAIAVFPLSQLGVHFGFLSFNFCWNKQWDEKDVEPRFSRFNGHTPQVIDSGFYTVVAPFVGAAIRNSVEVVFPCRQTVDTSITANFGQCHIHSSRYIRFQLQNLQYLDK